MATNSAVQAAAVDLDDEPYDSAEDEDFQLEGDQDESDLSSEGEGEQPAKKKRKSNNKTEIPDEELDSGDEATIRKAREKREKKRKGKKSKGKQAVEDEIDDLDDEEGGVGGFVRTRAMKKHMYVAPLWIHISIARSL